MNIMVILENGNEHRLLKLKEKNNKDNKNSTEL